MTIQEIIGTGGASLVILLTLIQVAPIKINPWSAIAKAFGRAINSDVLKELSEVRKSQNETAARLDEHIRIDDERDADLHRTRILRFNNELMRKLPHSREDFIEAMSDIDEYEHYCAEHENYENNRAECAIQNIRRVYFSHLEKNDFPL